MSLIDLPTIGQLFGMAEVNPSPEAYKELLLMVLSRATDVDAYTHPAEVDIVRDVLCKYLDEDVSSADVHIAAKSKLYETAPLEKYVSHIGSRLPKEDRVSMVNALIEVLLADDRIASAEAGYFNMICKSLKLDFADVVGLHSS
ncbi:MAG: TerB family tellurite resistance protein [Pseudomonadota bacterium]